jgi:hypothetical protein
MEGWDSERTAKSMGDKNKGDSPLKCIAPSKRKTKKASTREQKNIDVLWDPAWNIA